MLLNLPIFAETVARCDRVLRQKEIDIYRILTSHDKTIVHDILNAYVGIITVQVPTSKRIYLIMLRFLHRLFGGAVA